MKVLLVSGHPAVLFGLRNLLEGEDDLRVVGEADGVDEALSVTEMHRPDVVVVTDVFPAGRTSGVEVCRRIKLLSTPPYVLIYTEQNSSQDLARCALTGVDGYIHTGIDLARFVQAVKRVCAGMAVWEVGCMNKTAARGWLTAENGLRLSSREKEVLGLVLKRYSNAEIARDLYVGVRTVKAHMSSIFRKSGAKSRREVLELFGA
jgi:DNA-binding NarL/FixJ family response regulator